MAQLFKRTFYDAEGNKYELNAELDEEALAIRPDFDGEGEGSEGEYSFAIEVQAVKTPIDGRSTEISATVTTDFMAGVIRVEIEHHRFEVPLGMSIGGADSPLADAEHLVEELIGSIPVAFEPGLGCVIKAGVATVVGQIIRCNNEVSGEGALTLSGLWKKVKEVASCLRRNGVSMGRRAVFRTFRCWVTAGFS